MLPSGLFLEDGGHGGRVFFPSLLKTDQNYPAVGVSSVSGDGIWERSLELERC